MAVNSYKQDEHSTDVGKMKTLMRLFSYLLEYKKEILAVLAIMAFCFSMTVGVVWEFFECTMDHFFFLDMQKDTVVNAIGSVMLDPAGGNRCHRRAGRRNPDLAGAGRLPRHWPVGHDGGSVR